MSVTSRVILTAQDKNFDLHAIPDELIVGPRYVATFHPQAWQNDYAIPVDPEGERSWDVTAFLLSPEHDEKWRKEAKAGYNYEADELRHDPSAPRWVRDWQGPFEVEVKLQ